MRDASPLRGPRGTQRPRGTGDPPGVTASALHAAPAEPLPTVVGRRGPDHQCTGRHTMADPKSTALAKGLYIEPTVFADVTPSMRIFKEEIFGPVVSIIKWTNEAAMIDQVNSVEYG